MVTILTSSQQTFVDITDQRKLSAYITSNLPKTQSEDPNVLPHTYAPSWDSTSTITIPFTGYVGITQSACTCSVGTLPTGITVKTNTAATASAAGKLELSVAASSNLGADAALTGNITLTFTISGKTVTKVFTWTKSKAGSNGASAVVFSVYAPNGTIVQNQSGSILLATSAYAGSTAITSAAYQWAKYSSGSWTNISGETSETLTVSGSDIINIQSYRCTMTYGGKAYVDVITVEDKSDPYVSEMLSIGGYTVKNNLDLDNRIINIDHQLQRTSKMEYIIDSTKTKAGTRKIPMTEDVYETFRRILKERLRDLPEKMVDGYIGFLFRDKNGMPEVAMHWQHRFNHAVKRYNDIFKIQMPNITPHVCRHTYCSNQARAGMNPKTLQYLMGHSDIGVTMNTYTHLGLDDAKDEMIRLEELEQARKELDKTSGIKPIKQNMFKAI